MFDERLIWKINLGNCFALVGSRFNVAAAHAPAFLIGNHPFRFGIQ